MVRNPVDFYERSEFHWTIGETVYKDDGLPSTLGRSVKRLRLAIQEFAYTLNKLDVSKIRKKQSIEQMNS